MGIKTFPLISYENKGLRVLHVIKPIKDSNITPPGIDKSRSLRMIMILSFSSSIICMVLISIT